MNFNSLEFLIFLPIVVAVYWALPFRFRWIALLAASCVFYMSWNVWLIVLIFITTATAYICALLISRARSRAQKRLWLIVTLVVCLGLLIFFKYINFILESVVGVIRLFGGEQSDIVLDVILPVGISFYTFQTLSYVVDVYRGSYPAERHFGYFALYVSYFPQLVAGPIERPGALLPQLRTPQKCCAEDMLAGAKYLLSGFFRKCVVADFCGIFVDQVYADLASANALAVFAASALFLFQIYNDFAGYSEIALGSARLMGVKLSKNFDRPLASTSFTQFFRRWHITLYQGFTQYVYIPLGGNRKGRARKLLNTMIVFALCGLWHGANWTFVIWGLTAGVFICIETLIKKPCLTLLKELGIDPRGEAFMLARRCVVLLLFVLCCVPFRAQNVSEVGLAFSRMFGVWSLDAAYFDAAFESLGMSPLQLVMLITCIAAMGIIYRLTLEKPPEGLPLGAAEARVGYSVNMSVYIYGILAVAFCWLSLLSNSDVSMFAYFQF